MWTVVAIAGTLLGLWLVLRQCRALGDFPTQLLLFVLWLRYALHAFPQYTILKGVAGFSVISLFAIASALALLFFSPRNLYRLNHLGSLYVFFSIVILSSVISHSTGGLARDAVKWMYFVAVLVLVFRAVRIFGFHRIMRALLWTAATPLSLQIASYGLGKYKVGADGTINYIGGYYHEGLFSIIVLTFTILALLSGLRSRLVEVVVIVFSFWSLTVTNYRTTIIAAVPIILVAAWSVVSRPWGLRGRMIAASLALVAALVMLPNIASLVPERYVDTLDIISNPDVLSKSPTELSDEEKRLLSGRILLWAEYLQAVADSSSIEKLLGQGAHSYEGRMRLFAHNTFVSYLYEFGFIGLALILYVLLSNMMLAFTVPDAELRPRLIAAHMGFFILNLTTMPLWSTEGMTLFAIILGSTWAVHGQRHASALRGEAARGHEDFTGPRDHRAAPSRDLPDGPPRIPRRNWR